MIAFSDKYNSTLGKRIIAKRKEIVEHPFGTIKRNWDYTYFMQKCLVIMKKTIAFTQTVVQVRVIVL